MRYDRPTMKTRSRRSCPRCKHPVRRVHRSTVDYLINFVMPVKRLQCTDCGWSGLIVRPRPKRRLRPERVHEEVLKRRIRIGAMIFFVFVTIALTVGYLTLFVWNNPVRQPTTP
jgi:hypothetical protein